MGERNGERVIERQKRRERGEKNGEKVEKERVGGRQREWGWLQRAAVCVSDAVD